MSSKNADCPDGKIRNPRTKRCVKIGSKALNITAPKKKTRRVLAQTVPDVAAAPSRLKPCPDGKVRNPATNRCRNLRFLDGTLKPAASDYYYPVVNDHASPHKNEIYDFPEISPMSSSSSRKSSENKPKIMPKTVTIRVPRKELPPAVVVEPAPTLPEEVVVSEAERQPLVEPPAPPQPKGKGKVEKKIESQDMVIARTGIRSGEWITGITKATLNTTMQVYFPEGVVYPPHTPYVESMIDVDYRDKLNNLSFFKDKSPAERKNWLMSHASDDLFYLNDIPGVKIRLFSVGGEKIVDDENPNLYDDLMDGELHTLDEFFQRIPGGEKTRLNQGVEQLVVGGRHSLSFRGSLWKVKPDSLDLKPDMYCQLIGGILTRTDPAPNTKTNAQRRFQCIIKTDGDETQVIEMIDSLSPSAKTFKRHNWRNLARYVPEFAQWEPYYEMLKDEMGWFTPAIHKSIIQKLIRTRCKAVRLMNGKIVPPQAVVFASFVILVTEGGAFVPDIRRFVRGSESAFKRVGVAFGEDSFSSCETITAMLGAAMAAQNYPEFEPTEELVAYAIKETMISQADPRAWDYEVVIHKDRKAAEVKWRYPYYLLNTLGSFITDIGLLQSIGLNPTKLIPGCEQRPGMNIMNVEYCLDQHSLTNIAHFFRPRMVADSYVQVFKYLWIKGTGRNARKSDNIDDLDAEIAAAQKYMWLCKGTKRATLPLTGDMTPVNYKMDWSWMAGMLEKISVKVQVPGTRTSMLVNVFAHPESEGRFMAIRPASRDKAAEDLSEDVKELAIEAAKNILRTEGKPVRNRLIGVNGVAYYRETEDGSGEFMLNNVSWSNVYNSRISVPVAANILNTVEPDIMNDAHFFECCEKVFKYKCVADCGGSMTLNWERDISRILSSLSPETHARLAMYVRPLRPIIEMYRISRDGSSTYLMTSWKDTVVFRALMFISAYAPGVIYPDASLKFHVHDYRVWSMIRSMILTRAESAPAAWPMRFRDDRTLYAHQQAAVEQITGRIRNGKRGNLIWIPVGLGKTLIVSSVIGWMIRERKMPKYFVYSLPPSAMDSVTKELERGGFTVNQVKYTAKTKTNMFKPHCVNMIAHDNMRVASEHLVSLAPECFFVIDEFHLTMNDTKRTSIALEMAKLSHNFIGLTGTLIKDKSSKGVIEWVSQVVEFEVNEKNYWVAIAALVSRKIALPIPQERVFKEIEMSAAERHEYLGTIEKKFGGRASSTNFSAATKICYSVIQRGIIDLTLRLATPDNPRPVFVVAKDVGAQTAMREEFERKGKRVFCVSSKQSITLTPGDAKIYDVVITTCTHSTGFTLTQSDTMITAIYFSNQATRDQLEGRVLRMGQTAPKVSIYVLHTGLLTYTMKHYEDARSLRQSMEDLAVAVQI